MNHRKPSTERTMRARALPWFQALFSQLDHMVSVVDFDGHILQANRAMTEFLGVQPGQEASALLWDLLHASYGAETETLFRQAMRTAVQGETQCAELHIAGRDQTPHALLLSIKPFQVDEHETHILIEGKDITRQRLVEESLLASEHLLSTAMVGAPIMLFVVDQHGVIRLATGRGARSLRELIPNPHGKSIFNVYARFPQVIRNYERALAGETVEERLQLDHLTYAGYYAPMDDGNGNTVGVIGVHTDITQQTRTEEALVESHTRFETVFQAAGIGIVIKDGLGRFVNCNPAFLEMLGRSQEDLFQTHETGVTHPEDLELGTAQYQQLLEGKIDRYALEKRFIASDGRVVWGHVTTTRMPYREGEQLFTVEMIKDITARKEMEKELQEVQHRLLAAAEQERIRLAQDLHDGPLQGLISLNFNLQAIYGNGHSPETEGDIQKAQHMVQQISQHIRAICSNLRPPALAPFGLEKALRSHAEAFQAEHPELTVVLNLNPDGQTLAEPARLVLYRICQEALNNVLRHSAAKTVWVRYHIDDQHAELEVQDDGQGFSVPKRWIELAREGHLGLVGAAERAEAVGGFLEIKSAPGTGTLLRAIIPYEPNV